MKYRHILFDWGNTLMEDLPGQNGPMVSWPHVAVVPGAPEALSQLSRMAMCHIATNANESSEAEIRQALERGGLDTFISEIFCYRRIGHKKPDIRFFRHIQMALDTPLHQILMIGDSLENDVMGAGNAGMDAIWLNRHGGQAPTGTRTVCSLAELVDLLQ